jgi:tetratricopeptide (TPR) repeat protein
MTAQLDEVVRKQSEAKSFRKKGDALRKAGREEAAYKAYMAGINSLDDALAILKPESMVKELKAKHTVPSSERGTPLGELVEIFGMRGGLLQRVGDLKEALSSYSEGASLEDHFDLQSTYNRLNALKYALLVGDKRLHELGTQFEELAKHIEDNLHNDKSLSDSGWAWADLGDCLALLGRQERAKQAYLTFISKAEIKSPERTLDILQKIAAKLTASHDPDASRLQKAIDTLETGLKAH